MKQIIAVIKPWVVDKVIGAIQDVNFEEVSIREVKGYGRQKNYLDKYRENEYSRAFVPKIEISVWCHDEDVEAVIERVTEVSRTGRLGDGKVMVLPVLSSQIFPQEQPEG